MATNWLAEAQGVYADFKEEGFPITLRKKGSKGIWDPDSDQWVGGTPDEDFQTYGLKKYKSSAFMGQRHRNLTTPANTIADNIQLDVLFFPALGLPEGIDIANWRVVIDQLEYNMTHLFPIDPGNVKLMYEAWISAG